MTDQELLARIDERTLNIHKLIEVMEKHLEKINGAVENDLVRIQTLETKVDSHKNWLTGITSGIVVIVSGIIAAFTTHLWQGK